jgi:hypothetical protein
MNTERDYQGPDYPTNATGSIPAFHSYEEEADFWDTHHISTFKDETFPVQVRSTRGLTENVQVRFDADSDRELDTLAQERGLKKATLIRSWVLERLRQERERHAS